MRIRRGDMVQVVTGNDAGPAPRRVIKVIDGGRKVSVEGVNRVLKHVRRGHPKSPQGGQLKLELPIDSSNVMFYCDSCSHGVRLGVRYLADGSKERFCKACKGSAGQVSPPKASRATA